MAEIVDYPFLKIDDIYNTVFIRVFDFVKLIFGSFGLVLSILVMFIITTQSPPQMKKVKYYLLGYSCCNLALDLIAVLYSPVGISSYMLIYPRGLLAPMSATTSKFFVSAMLISLAGFGCFFMTMFVDRYFALTDYSTGKVVFYRNPSNYAILFGYLWLLFSILVIYLVFFTDFILPSEITNQIIKKFVNGSETLLDFQPDLLATNGKSLHKALFILSPFGLSYILCLLIFLALCYKNMNYAFGKLSANTRSQHLMVFKLILFQSWTLLFMVICPFIAIVIACTMKVEGLAIHLPFTIMWFFPIVDSLVTIMTIKPYRMFIFKIVKTNVPKFQVTSLAQAQN